MGKVNNFENVDQSWLTNDKCPGGGGGGGAVRYRVGPHLRYVFRGRRDLFLRPPHVRDFVKEGYFLVPRYKVWESEPAYTPRNIRRPDAE